MPAELSYDSIRITSPEVHADASTVISFTRTLRIPDDDTDYHLPPGLGRFPLREVEKLQTCPPEFARFGGYVLPMFQAEALWVSFGGGGYPYALKVAVGKVNAVTGEPLAEGLKGGDDQDYCPVPEQPWLDGICVEKGRIKQFIAMPLGSGFTVEEQVTGVAEFGGLQIIAYPMKGEVYEAKVKSQRGMLRGASFGLECAMPMAAASFGPSSVSMGLGAGGSMKQEIYRDAFDPTDYDLTQGVSMFVNIVNSQHWTGLTGEPVPQEPLSAAIYTRYGFPWFDLYSETPALEGSEVLAGVKSVNTLLKEQGGEELPDNVSLPEVQGPAAGPAVATAAEPETPAVSAAAAASDDD